MNSIESIKPDELIEEYGEWLKHESSAKDLGEWKEITLPMFDHSNDDLIFYAKTAGDRIMFTDDGYTLESFRQNGVTITEARRERMERIARKYGAGIKERRNSARIGWKTRRCHEPVTRRPSSASGP